MIFRLFVAIVLVFPVVSVGAHEPASPAVNPSREKSSSREAEAVKRVLNSYKVAVEKLDLAGTAGLFSSDSSVFESGGVEGNYAHYLEHHMTPELAEFSEFKYNDYLVAVRVEPPFAFATETYVYRLVVKADGKVVERQGVTTSVLRKERGQWRIFVSHNSSRAPKKT